MSVRELHHTELIGTAAITPIAGFMCQGEYETVLRTGRRINGHLIPIPVLLETDPQMDLNSTEAGLCIQLIDVYSNPVAKLSLECIFEAALNAKALSLESRSFVEHLRYVGGRIFDFQGVKHRPFQNFRVTPARMRDQIREFRIPRVFGILVPSLLFESDLRFLNQVLNSTNSLVILHVPVESGSEVQIPLAIRVRCIEATLKHPLLAGYSERVKLVLLPWFLVKPIEAREQLFYIQIAKNYGVSDVLITGMEILEGAKILAGEMQINALDWPFSGTSEMASLSKSLSTGERISATVLNPSAADILHSHFPEIHQRGLIVMFIGLSGSGKSTLASLLKERLESAPFNKLVSHIDGDEMRSTISKDLGFSHKDRLMHIKRMEVIASRIAYHRGVAILSTIAHQRYARSLIREAVKRETAANFLLIYVNTSVDVCRARDTKGLYQKARDGSIRTLVGVDIDFEEPLPGESDMNLSTDTSPTSSLDAIVAAIISKDFIRK